MKRMIILTQLLVFLASALVVSSQEARKVPQINFDPSIRATTIETVPLSDGEFDAFSLAKGILPPGTAVSNVTFNSIEGIGGFFQGFDANFDLNKGLVLGSGCITELSGNECLWTGTGGDVSLNALGAGYATYDAVILEFDFVSPVTPVVFDFIFASDDYISYDDVCAIFLDGVNIALLPSGQEVSVRTLEFTPNFILNDGSVFVYVDDYTPVFQAIANVTPNNTHHLKIAIADDDDSGVNSYLFIKGDLISRIPLSPWAIAIGIGLIAVFIVIRYRRLV